MEDTTSSTQQMADESMLFHENNMDESRWSKYDYSIEGDSVCDEFASRMPGATCDGSVCSLGQSLRDRYVPRSIYAEEEDVSESEVEEPEEEQVPPNHTRRGLLTSTKSGRLTLVSTKSESPERENSGSGGGSVWRSMRSMGFGKDRATEETEATGSVWKSMRAMTFSHSTSDSREKDEPESQNRPSFKMLDHGMPLGDDSESENQHDADELGPKKATSSKAKSDIEVAKKEAPVRSGMLQRSNSLKRASSFKLKKVFSLDTAKDEQVAGLKKCHSSTRMEKKNGPVRMVHRSNSSFKIMRPLMNLKDHSIEAEKETPMSMLKRASSFKMKKKALSLDKTTDESGSRLKKCYSSSGLEKNKDPVRMVKRNNSSFKIKRPLVKDQGTEGQKETPLSMLKRASSFKMMKKSLSLDTNGDSDSGLKKSSSSTLLKRSTSFIRKKHTTPSA